MSKRRGKRRSAAAFAGDAPPRNAPARKLRDDEKPVPVEVLALLERFPKPSRSEFAVRHALLAAVAAISLYGILARAWDAQALIVFFAFELGAIWLLNWLTIALLPTALSHNDRRIVKAWAWSAGVVVLVAVAYVAVEGRPAWDGMRNGVADAARDVHGYLRTSHLLWPVLGMLAVHLVDLAIDIAHWRMRGGQFRYWSGVTFLFRLWFCMAAGAFIGFFAWAALQSHPRGGALALWLVFLLADLFATWVPVWLRKKAVREGAIAA